MRKRLSLLIVLLACASHAQASGFLIPEDKKLPPLAMVSHKVAATIDEQVATTTVEQIFRNHTDRPLEATFLFPVPKGASVNKFSMWIDGKETSGELLDAKKANAIYTEIVRRTLDPGILEYMGTDLLKLRVFPIPARGDQKVKLQFTSIAQKEGSAVEYIYPMRTDIQATRTLEAFSVSVNIKSAHSIQSVYSPTHSIVLHRRSDREVVVEFDKNQATLDKDFQLFYGSSKQEIGITPIFYRPVSSDDGYFMMLISPQTESVKSQRVPRDVVLVLDKSGSMSDLKMAQAKKALKFCLNNLSEKDRFAMVSFATVVDNYRDDLSRATPDQLEKAHKWVDDLRQSGGTAILPALNAALGFRPKDEGRSFNVVFFTDGVPTVDETNPDRIIKSVAAKNSTSTRIFTFGVGDDVNSSMLDQLAESTRAVSTYVRPSEDIEAKMSSLYSKISHPVMTNVRLTCSNVRLHGIYPVQIPDLFHGNQLVLIGRFSGRGPATIKLTGQVGSETREIVEEVDFPSRTTDDKSFVEHLWARRKVGYILDQIRANGEQKELVDEVVALAKKYGIATPYTSYLVVPDGPMPVAAPGRFRANGIAPPGGGGFGGGGFGPSGGVSGPTPNTSVVAQQAAGKGDKDGVTSARGELQKQQVEDSLKALKPEESKSVVAESLKKAQRDQDNFDNAKKNYEGGKLSSNQTGTLGVDLSLASTNLRNQNQLSQTANRAAYGRNCVEVGGVWIDDKFDKKMPIVAIKAQGTAYFRILEKQAQMKDVYRLGNHVLWVTPNGNALVIDPKEGKDALTDDEIDKLFVAK